MQIIEADFSGQTTKKILSAFIATPLKSAVAFNWDARDADKLMQRCRVMLSRARTRSKNHGQRIKHFRLRSMYEPCSQPGMVRVTVWREQSIGDSIEESIEDIMIKHDKD